VDARVRSALLWGLVGALTVLVALQSYRLLVGPLRVSLAATAGLALGVAAVVTAVAYATEHRIEPNGRT
jgi:ABC-type nickel/cobalt efflux system permease component RcnA